MPTPNTSLRAAREAAASRRIPDECMSRSELADEVNRYLFNSTGKRYDLDRHQIARYERGEVRWPGAAYRAGFRAVLGAKSDSELGFISRRQAPAPSRSAGADEQPTGWHPSDVVATAEEMTSQDVTLSRRKALVSAAAVAGAALTEPLQGWLVRQRIRLTGTSAISGLNWTAGGKSRDNSRAGTTHRPDYSLAKLSSRCSTTSATASRTLPTVP
ncbi:hypothetical protein [Saccharopolyspora shandongensis]|uniref:hypothetical protein n=1 Tax=Saccharopolyspora shandongensis TaxID=418495 RepID=UPI003406FB49